MAPTDRSTLLALYRSTGGTNWPIREKWATDADISQWYGVTAGAGRVTKLSLHLNKLQGSIPPELGALGELLDLNLGRNDLGGIIPKELWALTKLEKLCLSPNQLTGPIPSALKDLSKLTALILGGNKLTGPIPTVLGALPHLEQLWLNRNDLSGPIPQELGALTQLVELWLSDNQFSGVIPEELGALSKLKVLSLSDNQLTGEIPGSLGKLGDLERLYLFKNQLTGSIPQELRGLKKVKILSLHSNQLTGSIPKELVALEKLEELCLHTNQLRAVWDHSSSSGDASGGRTQKGNAGQLRKLLALFSKVEQGQGYPRLRIDNNPWEEPPEAVVKKGMAAVSEYFADLFQEGVAPVPRRMIKVVLVGQEGAGKTSLRQSIRNRRPTPTSGPDESTVQIDVEELEMDADGVSLRVYDCAGQVAYTGLLQMFLSPRAVSLLVCNTKAFGPGDDRLSEEDQLNQDLIKLQELRVCDWLRSLSFRIPDSDVVVVATKCDLAGGMATNQAGRIERAVQKWLKFWRGSGMTAVRVEGGVSLTSCAATLASEEGGDTALGDRKRPEDSTWACDWCEDIGDDSPRGLLHRVKHNSTGGLRGAAMVLPRSWNIALHVLEALGCGRDPVESVRNMNLAADRPEGGKGLASTRGEKGKGIEALTMAELSAKWNDVVEDLKEDGVTVTNPKHALEGALCIREYEGSVVRHHTYIFLDVTWLVKILKPLLNHRHSEDPISGSWSLGDTGITLDNGEEIAAWERLKEDGVLEPALASVLWPGGLCDYVLPTLHSLGLTHPLDGDSADGLVVLLRLGEKRPADVGKELDDFRRDHIAMLSVTWKVYMGVPPGAIEKVLTRCCSIGSLRTFWRFGVLVQGGFGAVNAGKTFALLMEYSHDKNEIDMKVYGNIGNAAPWAALSFGLSAIRTMCSDFPGLRWRASLQCPQHEKAMQISTEATRPGDKLLRGRACSQCSSETGGLGAAAKDLLEMIDVLQSRDEIFQEIHEKFVKLQDSYPVLHPEALQILEPEQAQRRFGSWVRSIKGELQSLLDGAKGSTDEVANLRQELVEVKDQLGQPDVRKWLGERDQRVAHGIDADDRVMDKLDFVVTMMMAVRSEGFDTPRLACVLPPWKFSEAHGLSEKEQSPEEWGKRLEDWQKDDFKEGKGLFTKKKRLFLVCAHTLRLVPCGPNGQGYDIRQPRKWFRMSVSVTAFVLQVVCSTLAAMAAAPLSGAGAAVEATVSSAMKNFESMVEAQLAGLTLSDGRNVDVGPKATQLEQRAYASLREFIHGVEDTARLDIAKANGGRGAAPSLSAFVFFADEMAQVVQRDSGDAAVQWVLKGQEKAWIDAMRSAPSA